jgi:hypothetical protein
MKTKTIQMAEDEKLQLVFGKRIVADVEFNVSEQKFEISFPGTKGATSNPVLLFVDTQMLGHTEDDDSS